MTVALGIVCSDGVVAASDSLSSGGSRGLVAGKSTKVHKLDRFPIVWTASGSEHMIGEVDAELRQFDGEMDQQPDILAMFTKPDLDEVRDRLKNRVTQRMKLAYQGALPQGIQQGNPISPGHHPFESEFLLLGYANATPYFLHIDEYGGAAWVHTDNKFRAVGSGGDFAAVAGALMENYIGDDLPVSEGVKVAWRAIAATCRVSTMFVRVPVQIAVVDAAGPRIFGDDAIHEVEEGVEGWLQLERETIRPGGTEPAQEEPPKFEPDKA